MMLTFKRFQALPLACTPPVSAPLPRLLQRSGAVCALLLLIGCQSQTILGTAEPGTPPTGSRQDNRIVQPEASVSPELAAQVRLEVTSDPLPEPWINVIEPAFAQARQLVEEALSTDLSHIRLMLVKDQPINAEVAHETRRLVDAQFGISSFSDHFLSKVMQAQAGTFAALFASRLDAVMVSRNMLSSYERSLPADAEVRRAALLTLLIHEMVHAADDQRYAIHAKRALNFRASFAQSATFEGHAQWVTRQICAANGCLIGLDALDDFMFSRDAQPSQHSQAVEAISRNVLEYSYVEGERFIASLAERHNGAQLIDQLLSAPPQDPIQILAPDTFPDYEREARNQRLIRASRDIDHPWVGGSWTGVETSPLKGVNLRSDPSRRQAAVDGFTRLIHGMVAMQLYNRDEPSATPIEVTLLHAESAHTAKLFAQTLHDNTQLLGSVENDEPLRIRTGAGTSQSDMRTHVYRTTINEGMPYRTSIMVSGPYVVQIAGTAPKRETLDDFAIRVLLNLQLGSIQTAQGSLTH